MNGEMSCEPSVMNMGNVFDKLNNLKSDVIRLRELTLKVKCDVIRTEPELEEEAGTKIKSSPYSLAEELIAMMDVISEEINECNRNIQTVSEVVSISN